jgi:hypothetical protein
MGRADVCKVRKCGVEMLVVDTHYRRNCRLAMEVLYIAGKMLRE